VKSGASATRSGGRSCSTFDSDCLGHHFANTRVAHAPAVTAANATATTDHWTIESKSCTPDCWIFHETNRRGRNWSSHTHRLLLCGKQLR
jgi:hypothetical protein